MDDQLTLPRTICAQTKGRRRLGPTAGALVLLGGLLAGCDQSATPLADADPGLLHVHGLAVDPDDPEALFAATHTGLFQIKGSEAVRVGEDWHDLMGFTAAPDGTFYASGHPDLQSEELRTADGDPHLGLMRSADRGRHWEPVSLLGEVDFHALTLAGDTLIGADAANGRVLASEDEGETWQERSRLPLVSLAAHPANPQLLVGSSSEGLARSVDGGRTWTALDGPAPGYLTAGVGGFVVAHAQGEVAVSDDGAVWRTVGALPGPPEAMVRGTDERELFAAVAEVGLLRSEDGGRSWAAIYETPGVSGR